MAVPLALFVRTSRAPRSSSSNSTSETRPYTELAPNIKRNRYLGRVCSGSQLNKSGCAEIFIERIGVVEVFLAHQGEARGVDERVLALVMSGEPFPRLFLQFGRNVLEPNVTAVSNGSGTSRDSMTAAPVEQCPCFA
jgi:hypothetical protein